MILLDSDVLLIDMRYQRDVKFALNQQALQQLRADRAYLAITEQALLEVVGKLSFNTSASSVSLLPSYVLVRYRMIAVPHAHPHGSYASCTFAEIIGQMSQQMSLGDAVQAVQITKFAAKANCLLTWNARHFQGKIVIPVLTPEEWLNQRLSGTP